MCNLGCTAKVLVLGREHRSRVSGFGAPTTLFFQCLLFFYPTPNCQSLAAPWPSSCSRLPGYFLPAFRATSSICTGTLYSATFHDSIMSSCLRGSRLPGHSTEITAVAFLHSIQPLLELHLVNCVLITPIIKEDFLPVSLPIPWFLFTI